MRRGRVEDVRMALRLSSPRQIAKLNRKRAPREEGASALVKARAPLQRKGKRQPKFSGDRDATIAGPKTAGGRSAAAGFSPGDYGRNPVLWPHEELRSKLKRSMPPMRSKALGAGPNTTMAEWLCHTLNPTAVGGPTANVRKAPFLGPGMAPRPQWRPVPVDLSGARRQTSPK